MPPLAGCVSVVRNVVRVVVPLVPEHAVFTGKSAKRNYLAKSPSL